MSTKANNNTATFVKSFESANDWSSPKQSLYKLDPPLDGNEYVIVSAANVPFSGPETYIFASNEEGRITDWSELSGSYRGGLDHAEALDGAGYAVSK